MAQAELGPADKLPGQHCEAYFYAGMLRLLAGDPANGAEFLEKSIETQQKNYSEYTLAKAELRALNSEPSRKTPCRI